MVLKPLHRAATKVLSKQQRPRYFSKEKANISEEILGRALRPASISDKRDGWGRRVLLSPSRIALGGGIEIDGRFIGAQGASAMYSDNIPFQANAHTLDSDY